MKQIFSNEAIANVKAGMINIEGVGMGFCSEGSEEAMKAWMMGVNVGYGMGYVEGEEEGYEEGAEEVRSRVMEAMGR